MGKNGVNGYGPPPKRPTQFTLSKKMRRKLRDDMERRKAAEKAKKAEPSNEPPAAMDPNAP